MSQRNSGRYAQHDIGKHIHNTVTYYNRNWKQMSMVTAMWSYSIHGEIEQLQLHTPMDEGRK
jgi:hypothetical protein